MFLVHFQSFMFRGGSREIRPRGTGFDHIQCFVDIKVVVVTVKGMSGRTGNNRHNVCLFGVGTGGGEIRMIARILSREWKMRLSILVGAVRRVR